MVQMQAQVQLPSRFLCFRNRIQKLLQLLDQETAQEAVSETMTSHCPLPVTESRCPGRQLVRGCPHRHDPSGSLNEIPRSDPG